MLSWTGVTLLAQFFYLGSSSFIVLVYYIPDLNRRFLSYGARALRKRSRDGFVSSFESVSDILDYIASWTVPHAWFGHFYVTSSLCSCFWLLQLRHGTLLSELTSSRIRHSSLCIMLMLAQGLRRLVECWTLTQPSSSRMWIGHYAIGIAFYVITNIAIWVEFVAHGDNTHGWEMDGTDMSNKLPKRHLLSLLLFFSASLGQNRVHVYLASLKKYTLPRHWMFVGFRSMTPHYLCESVIYLSLAMLSTSETSSFNRTMWTAVVFVVVNLGVTADGTRSWAVQKFADERSEVEKRYRMVPFVW